MVQRWEVWEDIFGRLVGIYLLDYLGFGMWFMMMGCFDHICSFLLWLVVFGDWLRFSFGSFDHYHEGRWYGSHVIYLWFV